MNGKEILVDTNIILYLLAGSDTLEEILQGKDIYLSFITELELIGYKGDSEVRETQIVNLINDCSIVSMNNLIKEKYVKLRKQHNLKLADTIIAATSMVFDLPVITADKQFRTVNGLRLISYQHIIKRNN